MKCLILCGGRGVIDPNTNQRIPKSMIKIGNKPLLWHVMKLYSNYGYTDFVLALGTGSELIKQYFINSVEYLHDIEVNLQNKNIKTLNTITEENWTIKLIDTGYTANTGARISRCKKYLNDATFFISYSDILANIDITNLLDYHHNNKKIITITGVIPPSRFGSFYQQENGNLTYKLDSKLEMENSKINGGFMVANPEIFEFLSPINECNLEKEVFEDLVKKKQVSIFSHNYFWHNIDTERDIEIIQQLYNNNKRPWLGLN